MPSLAELNAVNTSTGPSVFNEASKLTPSLNQTNAQTGLFNQQANQTKANVGLIQQQSALAQQQAQSAQLDNAITKGTIIYGHILGVKSQGDLDNAKKSLVNSGVMSSDQANAALGNTYDKDWNDTHQGFMDQTIGALKQKKRAADVQDTLAKAYQAQGGAYNNVVQGRTRDIINNPPTPIPAPPGTQNVSPLGQSSVQSQDLKPLYDNSDQNQTNQPIVNVPPSNSLPPAGASGQQIIQGNGNNLPAQLPVTKQDNVMPNNIKQETPNSIDSQSSEDKINYGIPNSTFNENSPSFQRLSALPSKQIEARQIANGVKAPLEEGGDLGAVNALTNRAAAELNPNMSPDKAAPKLQTINSFKNGKDADAIRILNNTSADFKVLLNAAKNAKNDPSPWLNQYINWYNTNTGSTEKIPLYVAAHNFASEFAKVNTSGVATKSATHEASVGVDPTYNYKQFLAAASPIANGIANRASDFNNQYKKGVGDNNAYYPVLNPENAINILKLAGVNRLTTSKVNAFMRGASVDQIKAVK